MRACISSISMKKSDVLCNSTCVIRLKDTTSRKKLKCKIVFFFEMYTSIKYILVVHCGENIVPLLEIIILYRAIYSLWVIIHTVCIRTKLQLAKPSCAIESKCFVQQNNFEAYDLRGFKTLLGTLRYKCVHCKVCGIQIKRRGFAAKRIVSPSVDSQINHWRDNFYDRD